MKKAILSTLRVICAGAMSLYAVSCYDDSALREDLAALSARVDSLEKSLNDEVKNVNNLSSSVTALETSLQAAIQANGAAVQEALEAKLAALDEKLAAAIAEGDQALADALAAEKAAFELAMQALQDGITSVTGDVEDLAAALATLEATIGTKYTELLAAMDQADGRLDGKIADLAAGVEAAKKEYAAATTALSEELLGKIAEAVAKIAVVNVDVQADKVVLTLANGETVELSKPVENADNNGLVTIITDEETKAKYWAVIVDGEPQSLNIMVGSDVQLEFDIVDGELMFSTNGTDWASTGAFVADDADNLINIYQGETEEIDWETYEYIKEDFYTVEFGGETYYLPLYKVDNSVVAIKAGKTYFTYGEAKTIDVVLSDITSMYVMAKPDGWRANLDGKKLTVTAPAEAAIAAGYAEANGEVLLHCTTAEGKCKIAKLAVATTPGFSLTVSEDGALVITNPEVVTMTTPLGDTLTDFNDALVGLAELAAFEADPVGYVKDIDNNGDALYYYLSNWKMNTAEMDEDWNMIYTIGGEYVPGEYEIDVIETTVPQMYADWTYGEEIPATPFVVWACPVDENGMPRTADLVYSYYYPSVKATITEVAVSTSDVEVAINVVGADRYCVGLVTDEQLYGFPIDTFMQMSEGPFGQFQQYLQWAPDYAFEPMGTMFGGESGEQMPETITASMLNYGQPLMPNTKFYMWVFPVVDGVELADYTYEKNLKPYIYEFTTAGLTAGGSATVEFGEATLSFTDMSVKLASEGSTMIYYNWFDLDTYNEFEDGAVTEALLNEGYVLGADSNVAVNQNDITPGSVFVLAALAVDVEGKYGEVSTETYTAPELAFSETFKASFGEYESSVYYSGYRYNFPIAVEGGEAAKYYYVWSETEYSDEQLANLPLSYAYDYNFRSTTNVAAGQLAGQYANASSTYYLAVVVESTTGELSPVIKMTVEVPAVEE